MREPGIDGALAGRLAALQAALDELSRRGALDPDEPRSINIILEQMSDVAALPGGAEALVARYGADERVAIVRPLAFLLGAAVNSRDRAHALASTALALICALATPDPWPRLNLCTAIQRLLMFDAVGTLDPVPAAAVVKLLHESLASVAAVRATAVTVVADLFYGKRTALAASDRDGLLQVVLGLVNDPDELTRDEARALRDHLTSS